MNREAAVTGQNPCRAASNIIASFTSSLDRFILLAVAITALLSGPLSAQQPFVRANDVSFSVRTEQKQYQIGDKIVVSYTITNVSNGPATVPRSAWDPDCTNGPHLYARLEDSSGSHYEGGYGGSCVGWEGFHTRNPADKLAQVAVLLKPGQSTSGTFTYDSGAFSNELKPGTYRLEASCLAGAPTIATPNCRTFPNWVRHFFSEKQTQPHRSN